MAKRIHDKPLTTHQPFDEALERFIGTDPAEVRDLIAASKEAKPRAVRKVGTNATKPRNKPKRDR